MPVNILQYCGAVRVFNNCKFTKKLQYKEISKLKFIHTCFISDHLSLQSHSMVSFFMLLIVFFLLKPKVPKGVKFSAFAMLYVVCIYLLSVKWLYKIFLILLSGDVEINPGPRRNTDETFSICHWNLNSLLAYNYNKLFLLRAYIAVHKFDVICLSETYLDSTVASDDENLEITGYNLVRSDHPANTKRGGVCLYYKTCLPLRVLDIQYLNECINFELKIGDKLCTFVALYRSPSQSLDNFETFIDNFELNLETLSRKNPFLLVAIGDFNAKSKVWYCNDNTTSQGKALENVTSQFGLHQVIKEPTHILHNSSSCIDLIFASQPNLIIESGVHPSLHPNCHHQLIYAKFNLQIYYPPQYYREVWHYNNANTELIRRAVDQFNWQKAFLNKHVSEKVNIFNEKF